MAGNQNDFKGVRIGRYKDDSEKLANDLHKYLGNDVVFFCVGTDRITGDSFAPLIGTMLVDKGYENVIGTIDDPAHGQNLSERMKEIPQGKKVLAIDASLGSLQNVGSMLLNSGALLAGKGVGKDLPPVGDFHIQGIVNSGLNDVKLNFELLKCTRLSTVMRMAKLCVSAIESAYPLYATKFNENKIVKLGER